MIKLLYFNIIFKRIFKFIYNYKNFKNLNKSDSLKICSIYIFILSINKLFLKYFYINSSNNEINIKTISNIKYIFQKFYKMYVYNKNIFNDLDITKQIYFLFTDIFFKIKEENYFSKNIKPFFCDYYYFDDDNVVDYYYITDILFYNPKNININNIYFEQIFNTIKAKNIFLEYFLFDEKKDEYLDELKIEDFINFHLNNKKIELSNYENLFNLPISFYIETEEQICNFFSFRKKKKIIFLINETIETFKHAFSNYVLNENEFLFIEIEILNKHSIFILDFSGSMIENKALPNLVILLKSLQNYEKNNISKKSYIIFAKYAKLMNTFFFKNNSLIINKNDYIINSVTNYFSNWNIEENYFEFYNKIKELNNQHSIGLKTIYDFPIYLFLKKINQIDNFIDNYLINMYDSNYANSFFNILKIKYLNNNFFYILDEKSEFYLKKNKINKNYFTKYIQVLLFKNDFDDLLSISKITNINIKNINNVIEFSSELTNNLFYSSNINKVEKIDLKNNNNNDLNENNLLFELNYKYIEINFFTDGLANIDIFIPFCFFLVDFFKSSNVNKVFFNFIHLDYSSEKVYEKNIIKKVKNLKIFLESLFDYLNTNNQKIDFDLKIINEIKNENNEHLNNINIFSTKIKQSFDELNLTKINTINTVSGKTPFNIILKNEQF